jgi:hypothetical protein
VLNTRQARRRIFDATHVLPQLHTICRWLQDGDIPATRGPHGWRIPEAAIEAIIARYLKQETTCLTPTEPARPTKTPDQPDPDQPGPHRRPGSAARTSQARIDRPSPSNKPASESEKPQDTRPRHQPCTASSTTNAFTGRK